MRTFSILSLLAGFVLVTGCATGAPPQSPPIELNDAVAPSRVRTLLRILAADSMEGRQAATPGYARAAKFVAEEMQRIGLTSAGDSGYFQRVAAFRNPQGRLVVLPSFAAWDTIPAGQRVLDVNVVGVIPGVDPELKDEVVVVGAHLDHVGITGRPGARCPAVGADSICNGADDDASGVVTVLETARTLAAGPPPKRTIVFIGFTGEEGGPSGSRWYIEHPVRPIARTVAQFQIEMVARPDSLAGGPGKAWLTGYERSTLGDMLTAAGIAIVADPRPTQNFFRRSDNYRFAMAGIPSHAFSSFGMHTDYHNAGDGAEKADYEHMAEVIRSAAKAVRLLADGPRPEWKPGGQPQPPAPVPPSPPSPP
jgi:peptidase M28-like protein